MTDEERVKQHFPDAVCICLRDETDLLNGVHIQWFQVMSGSTRLSIVATGEHGARKAWADAAQRLKEKK